MDCSAVIFRSRNKLNVRLICTNHFNKELELCNKHKSNPAERLPFLRIADVSHSMKTALFCIKSGITNVIGVS